MVKNKLLWLSLLFSGSYSYSADGTQNQLHIQLIHAVRKGNKDEAQALIESFVNQTQSDGTTSLYVAAKNGHLEIAELLIKAKANVNQAQQNGETPLYVAVKKPIKKWLNSFFKPMRMLIKHNKMGERHCMLPLTKTTKKLLNFLLKPKQMLIKAKKIT